jgi:hypothetical protein
MFKLWIAKGHIKLETKIQLYNAIVLPHFTYNGDAIPYKPRDIDKLDSAHRKHLRKILNINYPNKISNAEVYKRTQSHPVSLDIISARWNNLRHLLISDQLTPAVRALELFYKTPKQRDRYQAGPFLSALPYVINAEYKRLPEQIRSNYGLLEIKTTRDIKALATIADDWDAWKELYFMIIETHSELYNARDKRKHLKRRRDAAEDVTVYDNIQAQNQQIFIQKKQKRK